MRTNGIFTKYCYKCGKIMSRGVFTCPHCNENLLSYREQDQIRCPYCRTYMPIHANYCKVCNTKNISVKHKKDNEMLAMLKKAADTYEKENYPEEYTKRKISNIKCELNVIHCYGQFKKAKKIFVKTNDDNINIKTFEYGQDFLKYDEIISCYRVEKNKVKDLFQVEVESILPQDQCLIINTLKGNIILEDTNQADNLLKCIYYHFDDNVVEFYDSFYNGIFDEFIFEKYKKEVGE